MPLVLTISGNEAAELGPNAVKSFDRSGGIVGRGSQADWILPDATSLRMSQRHFRVDFRDGHYFLTDLSRNGTFLNGSDVPMGKDSTVQLADGDVVEIAHYRIEARIRETPGIGDDSSWNDPAKESLRNLEDDAGVDPLSWLPGPGSPPPAAKPGALPDHSPITSNALDRPPAPADPSGRQSGIPDDWNPFETREAQPSGKPPNPQTSSPGAGSASHSAIPDHWDPFGESDPPAPPPEPPRGTPSETAQEKAPPRPGIGGETGGPTPADRPPTPAHPPKSPPPPVEPAEAERPAGQSPSHDHPPRSAETTGQEFAAFLRGAGIDENALGRMSPDEFMELVGRLFHNIVHDVRELLLARANVKSGFRLDLTMIQARENNPLKFSVGDETELIRNLFDTRGGGYLDAESAFAEAFRDIRDHQIGVLRGMRAAFDGVLDRFDPTRIEKETKIRGIAFSRKALLWDAYMESYPDIAREVKDGDWLLSNPDFQKGYSKSDGGD